MGLVTVAVGTLGVASASAAGPELVNTKGEKLKDKHITISGSNSGLEFSYKGIDCKSVSATGEVTSKTTLDKLVVEWNECANGLEKCYNVEKTSTIKSEPLTGTLVYINKSSKEVGLILEKETQTEKEKLSGKPLWATIKCGGSSLNLKGHLIGSMSSTHEGISQPLTYRQEDFVQEPSQYEGGPTGDQLTWSSPGGELSGNVALASSQEIHFEEEALIYT